MQKLNIAFIWHFHQPNYQENYESEFFLPWVRLHASKDYLDMLKRIDKFENLKLNFNFSPVLLGACQKYAKGFIDVHLKIFLKDENELSLKDKTIILNNYFDLNYKNMVLKRPYFTELYNKRAQAQELSCNLFSNREYVDIMTNYTLCWIDESFRDEYPELDELFRKERDYTLKDRRKIYEIQLDIITRILKEYKQYQDQGKIEVSISPYYHPILPLLLDFKQKEIKNFENLPHDFSHLDDAKEQIERARAKYVEIFDRNPKGMWLPELCICPKTAELLSKSGFLWTVSDEGVLSKSIKREFSRDFEGNLENPYELNLCYKTKSNNPLNILFSNSFFANLLNFGYGNYDYKIAANDMYEKIKTIQSKLQNSPKKNHILTIALDGENCWETYENDGSGFLDTLYGLISNDETLETVLVSDYIENNESEVLENLKSGSWINRNFDMWIGEPTKNIAWLYLSSVYADWINFKKQHEKDTKWIDKIEEAKRELLICQSSDWYWWYGEPNNSKSDDIFDYLFRNHLMNVYKILNLTVPDYLLNPLTVSVSRTMKVPVDIISPSLCCDTKDKKGEWDDAGMIFIPDGPISDISRLIKKIYYGFDNDNIYFRFELNKNSIRFKAAELENEIALYFVTDDAPDVSSVRYIHKNENIIYPITKNKFSREIKFKITSKKLSQISFIKSIPWNLWSRISRKKLKIAYKDVVEMKIPFEDLGFSSGNLAFVVVDMADEFISEVYPQDVLMFVGR